MRDETCCCHYTAERVLLYASTHTGQHNHSLSCGALVGTRNSSMGQTQECYFKALHFAMIHYQKMSWHFRCPKPTITTLASVHYKWVVGSILHGVDPLSYFSFQPVLHDWCNKGRGMCYPVCGMVHIKEPLLLIDKSSLYGGSGFPFSLSEWSLTICLTPYNRR